MGRLDAELREIACGLFLRSLADCSIERAFADKVKRVSDGRGRELLAIGEDTIDLECIRRIRVIAVGKAASAMLQALLPSLRGLPRCEISGVLIAGDRPSNLPAGFVFFAGGHPTPNQASIDGARAALEVVRALRVDGSMEDALCLFLISGGASAMMELPLDPAISQEDTVSFHRELVHSGGSISEINCVRKHFSAVKGGRLALEGEGVLSYSLLVSDVPESQLDALGSGPTLPDRSTVEQCREILKRYGLMERFPASVREFFLSPQLRETPKAAHLSSRAVTILAAEDISELVKQRAEELGFYAVVDNTCDDWDYAAAAEYLLQRLRELRREHDDVCLISSGEVTVQLSGDAAGDVDGMGKAGVGGRNQHFVLYAATLLRRSDASVAVLSAGTDGVDGNSSAAGAVVDERTLSNERPLAEARIALRGFDSGGFLGDMGLTVSTGPTGNNLRDLRILLARTSSESGRGLDVLSQDEGGF
jgi:glycerate 2-kinase